MDPVDQIVAALTQDDAVLFAYLFGSRAGERARADSDWDIAVYFDDGLSAKQRLEHRLRIGSDLSSVGDVQVVALNEAPPLLAHRALGGRRLLVKDPVRFTRFFVRTMARAEDDRYVRDLHRRARRERLEGGRYGRP